MSLSVLRQKTQKTPETLPRLRDYRILSTWIRCEQYFASGNDANCLHSSMHSSKRAQKLFSNVTASRLWGRNSYRRLSMMIASEVHGVPPFDKHQIQKGEKCSTAQFLLLSCSLRDINFVKFVVVIEVLLKHVGKRPNLPAWCAGERSVV